MALIIWKSVLRYCEEFVMSQRGRPGIMVPIMIFIIMPMRCVALSVMQAVMQLLSAVRIHGLRMCMK